MSETDKNRNIFCVVLGILNVLVGVILILLQQSSATFFGALLLMIGVALILIFNDIPKEIGGRILLAGALIVISFFVFGLRSCTNQAAKEYERKPHRKHHASLIMNCGMNQLRSFQNQCVYE